MKRPAPARKSPAAPNERRIARSLETWFAANARPFPWRPADVRGRRDPWVSLVSEFMLQQTQAGRVAERLPGFLARFATPADLAKASERRVLTAWAGLGYYRRATLLRACAKEIVARFGGAVPASVADLRTLPGVGEYTAGSIASIVFRKREAIVDANVARVVLRLEGRELPVAAPEARALAWERARSLVAAASEPALLNEGLMELGAAICTPPAPRCGSCPIAGACEARARGTAAKIPSRKAAPARKTVHHACVIVRRGSNTLLERRPSRAAGAEALWAGMWQPPTLERTDRAPKAAEIAAWLGVARVRRLRRFTHTLSHRVVAFAVWESAPPPSKAEPRGVFKTPAQIRRLPLASPHARILAADAPA